MSSPRQASVPAAPAVPIAGAHSRYRWDGPTDLLRQAARAIDFVHLVVRLARSGVLPPIGSLRRSVLLELGPGPTKLRLLKRLMFDRVHFVDSDPFGPEREDLTLMDLEELRSVSLQELLGAERTAPVLLFADHCLEHLSRDTIDHLLVMAGAMGAACLIRVPNVLSPEGRLHFEDDPTHRTPFDEGHRRALVALGLSVTPHARWYRRGLRGPAPRAAPMDVAEEVVIAGRPSAAPASIPTEHA